MKESEDTLTLLFNASFNDDVPFELDTIKNWLLNGLKNYKTEIEEQ